MNKLAASELVLNDDGSVYHLNLLPEDIAEKKLYWLEIRTGFLKYLNILTKLKSKKISAVYTHTGTLRGERITVMSTGIGTEI